MTTFGPLLDWLSDYLWAGFWTTFGLLLVLDWFLTTFGLVSECFWPSFGLLWDRFKIKYAEW